MYRSLYYFRDWSLPDSVRPLAYVLLINSLIDVDGSDCCYGKRRARADITINVCRRRDLDACGVMDDSSAAFDRSRRQFGESGWRR